MRASFPVFFLGEEMTHGLVFSGDNTRGQCLRDASCFIYLFIFKFYFIFQLYIIVLVLPNIKIVLF